MNFKYIDNHCHLNLLEFDMDYKDVFNRAVDSGVQVINVGTDKETSKRAMDMANELGCFAIVGLHPNSFNEGFDYEYYKYLATNPKVVGIGECGLDYFRSEEDAKERQKEIFKKQIELSIETDKPLMLHIRDSGTGQAYLDVIEILESFNTDHKSKLRGNVHFFAGTKEIAQRFLDLGFTLSFTGAITYPPKKGEDKNQYEEIITMTPIDRILSETDCPFVAPVPFRGKRNEPAYVIEVIKKIAEIKNLSFEEVSEQLLKNSKKLFGI